MITSYFDNYCRVYLTPIPFLSICFNIIMVYNIAEVLLSPFILFFNFGAKVVHIYIYIYIYIYTSSLSPSLSLSSPSLCGCVHDTCVYVCYIFSLNQYSSRTYANRHLRIHHHLRVLASRGFYTALLYLLTYFVCFRCLQSKLGNLNIYTQIQTMNRILFLH